MAHYHEQVLTAHKLMAVADDYPLFKDVNFTLKSGEALWVEGANGAGKSTLLAILAGLLTPFHGSYNAIDSHYIGHDNGLHPHERVQDCLCLWAKLYQQPYDNNEALLAEFNLQNYRATFTHQLSAGQKRKLNLLRLKITPRPLWILDEADSALDVDSRKIFKQWLEAHLAQNGMLIFTSHSAPPIQPHHHITLNISAPEYV